MGDIIQVMATLIVLVVVVGIMWVILNFAIAKFKIEEPWILVIRAIVFLAIFLTLMRYFGIFAWPPVRW